MIYFKKNLLIFVFLGFVMFSNSLLFAQSECVRNIIPVALKLEIDPTSEGVIETNEENNGLRFSIRL